MAASKGNISFAHAHCYFVFSRDLSTIDTATTAALKWDAVQALFPLASYINQANSVTLPVQTANTIDIQNMGAEATAKLADLPSLSDAVVEVGWVNDNTTIKTLSTKTVGDDIAVCLLLNSDDAATRPILWMTAPKLRSRCMAARLPALSLFRQSRVLAQWSE